MPPSVDLELVYSYLIEHLFPNARAEQCQLVDKAAQFDGNVRFIDGELVFSLPDLFRFALQEIGLNSGDSAEDAYITFRRLIYQRPTNTKLATIGLTIVLERVSTDHDLSVYRLKRL